MQKAHVHIVMATYNGEKYIREQLDSLLSQTYQNISVEICDDGSTDMTLAIAKEYCAEDSRVSLVENEKNQGYVRNFLHGIKRSEADYVMLCDQDDIWNADKVAITLSAMQGAEQEMPGVPILVYTDAMNYDSRTKKDIGRFHKASHLQVKKVDTPHLFMENKCIGCTIMLNRSLVMCVEDMPEEIRVHDWWLALIAAHFGQIVYVDKATLRYRQHDDNMIGGDSYHSYVQERASRLQEQRQVLHKTYEQAAAFLRCYRDKMNDEQIRVAEKFASMEQANWFVRRKRVICDGYRKSGLLRNVGLLLLM